MQTLRYYIQQVDNMRAGIESLENDICRLRNNRNIAEALKNIEDDARPSIKILYKELVDRRTELESLLGKFVHFENVMGGYAPCP